MSEAFKARLSSQQAEVVNHVDGPLLVIAGPGSGKTRVLTERVRALLTSESGHFHVLALTFTNKAADEMRDRLLDLEDVRERAFIGTLHSFCLDLLTERGKAIGITETLSIFEQIKDRKEVLLKAIADDPYLSEEISQIADAKDRTRRVDAWLQTISHIKSHPITCAIVEEESMMRVLDAYEAGMRACNAYDFDDLLLLTYRLLIANPKLADIYRRLYRFICIDEAQDMNEAQYAVVCALCSDGYRNLMMVGDPKQSIYGFNTSGPEYMERFRIDFEPRVIELNENFRSSKEVVRMAQSLDPNYMVEAQLPISGEVRILTGVNEENEAEVIVEKLQQLFVNGHPDVEGGIEPSKCAILGRNRFVLLAVEKELRKHNVLFYKRLTANHENESEVVENFQLALRVLANPRDRLHLSALAKKWNIPDPKTDSDFLSLLNTMASSANVLGSFAVYEAIKAVTSSSAHLDLMPALRELEKYADSMKEPDRLAIYEDTAVFRQEWDQYLRSASGLKSISSFMSSKALGATQKANREGVALLTVHSAKGLEFDVVFIAGMAEGTFPDYRANSPKEQAEERRNAFVAVTRSKRLLYLTYPATRMMPWGDTRAQQRSRFMAEVS